MAVWDDPDELGRRVAAARAYLREDQATFGKRIGRSDKTLGKIERGELASVGPRPQDRRQLAELVAAIDGVPAELFGLEEGGEVSERIEGLAQELAALRDLVLRPEDEEIRAAVRAAADAERQYGSTSRRSAEPLSGEANA
jgi:transcriptional regulator with XRE-family HTH domain